MLVNKEKNHKDYKNEDLECFSKLKLKVEKSKDDLGRTIQYFKNHTYNIGNCVAKVLNQQVTIQNKKNNRLSQTKKKLMNNNSSLSRQSFFKINEQKARNFKSEKDVHYSINKDQDNKVNQSLLVALQPKKRSKTSSIFPFLQALNTTPPLNKSVKTNNHFRKEESSENNAIHNTSKFLSPNGKSFSKDNKINKVNSISHDIQIKDQGRNEVGKKQKVISIIDNPSFDGNIDKNYLSTHTFSTLTNSDRHELSKKEKKYVFEKNNTWSKDMNSTHHKNFTKTLNILYQTDGKLLKKNPKSRTHLDIIDNYRSVNFNSTNSFHKSLFSSEFNRIKQEESYIKEKNVELLEELIKMTKNKIEIDPFKQEFRKDLKILDKINITKSVYIFGKNMAKPQILMEKGENIFIETDKISKINSRSAYNSKEILLEKFKIVQNNKNPNLINFKVKTKKDNDDELYGKGKDKFKIVRSLCQKIIKRRKEFLSNYV